MWVAQEAMSPAHLDEHGDQADCHTICGQLRDPAEAGQHCEAQGGAGNLLALLISIRNDHALQANMEFMAWQLSRLAGSSHALRKVFTKPLLAAVAARKSVLEWSCQIGRAHV